MMFSEEEVQSSELEMGLSSFEERGVPEVSSRLAHLRALNICCSLKEKDESRIGSRFQISPFVKIRISDRDNRACTSFPNEVCFYEANFVSGLHFLVHPFIRELLFCLKLAPTQLVPNSWRIVVYCMVMWMSANEGDVIG